MTNGEDEDLVDYITLNGIKFIRADLAERGVCRPILVHEPEFIEEESWIYRCPQYDDDFTGPLENFCPRCGGQIVTEDKGDE